MYKAHLLDNFPLRKGNDSTIQSVPYTHRLLAAQAMVKFFWVRIYSGSSGGE